MPAGGGFHRHRGLSVGEIEGCVLRRGVPSAVFSCIVRLSVPGAGLLEVVEELGWLDGDVQALNTATGAVSSAAATVTCFNMTAA